MSRSDQQGERPRIRGLIIFCVLASLSLSSNGGLWALFAMTSTSTLGQGSLLTRASLADSAVGRLEKRIQSFENKTYRRLTPLASPSSPIELGLLDLYSRYLSVSQSEQFNSLAAFSPPGDRAPPAAGRNSNLTLSSAPDRTALSM